MTTVFTSFYPWEAHLARHLLELEGIESHIADEGMIGSQWLYANAVGGVKLQVRGQDAELALQVLEGMRYGERQAGDELPDCPRCGLATRPSALLRGLCLFSTYLFLGAPIFPRRERKCPACGKSRRG